ncbi:unnamed protein product [Amoebophrya sp. A120]|nr:unnamed protein product [Amoebophrya sp. A120]|eukprot:GSA120T00014090001.1
MESCEEFSREMIRRREKHGARRVSAKRVSSCLQSQGQLSRVCVLPSCGAGARSRLLTLLSHVFLFLLANHHLRHLLVAAERPGFLAQTPKPDPGKENDRGGGVALQRAIIEWDNYLFDTASSMLQELYSKTKEQVVAVGMKWTAAEEEAEAGSANGSASSSSIKRKHPDGRKRWEQQSKVEKHQGANDEDFIPAENEFLDEQEDEDASKSQSSAVEKKKKKKFLDEKKSQAEAQQRGTTGLGQHEDPKRRSSRAGGGRGGKNDFLGEEEEPDFDSKPGTGSSSGLQKNNAVPHLPLGEQGRTRREGPPPPEDKLAAGATTSSDQVPAHEVAPVRDETDEQNGDSAAQSALQVKTGAKACDEVKNQDENKPEASALQNMKDEIKTSKSTTSPQQAAVLTPRPTAGAGRGGGGEKAETSTDDVHQPLSTGGGKNGGEQQEVRVQQKQTQTDTTSAIPSVVFPSTSTASPGAHEDSLDHHPQGRTGATAVNKTRTSNNANDVDAVSELEQGQGHLPGKTVVNTTRVSVFLVSSSTTTTTTTIDPLTTTTAPFQDSLLDAPSIAEPPMMLPSGESAGSDGRATSTALVVWTPSPKMSTTSTSTSTWSSSSSSPVAEWAMEQLKAALMSDDDVAGKMAPGQHQEHEKKSPGARLRTAKNNATEEPAEEFLQLKLAGEPVTGFPVSDPIEVSELPKGEGTTGSKKYDVFVLSAAETILDPLAMPSTWNLMVHQVPLPAALKREPENVPPDVYDPLFFTKEMETRAETPPEWFQLSIPALDATGTAKTAGGGEGGSLVLADGGDHGVGEPENLDQAISAAWDLEFFLNYKNKKEHTRPTESRGMLCEQYIAGSDDTYGGKNCLRGSDSEDEEGGTPTTSCRVILALHVPKENKCQPVFFVREVVSEDSSKPSTSLARRHPLSVLSTSQGATALYKGSDEDKYRTAEILTQQASKILAEQSLGSWLLRQVTVQKLLSAFSLVKSSAAFLALVAGGGLTLWSAVFGVGSLVWALLDGVVAPRLARRELWGWLDRGINGLPRFRRFAVKWAADRGWGAHGHWPHGKFLRRFAEDKVVHKSGTMATKVAAKAVAKHHGTLVLAAEAGSIYYSMIAPYLWSAVFKATASGITRDLQIHLYDKIAMEAVPDLEKLKSAEVDEPLDTELFLGSDELRELGTEVRKSKIWKTIVLRLGVTVAAKEPADVFAWHYLELAAKEEEQQSTSSAKTTAGYADGEIIKLSARTKALLEAAVLSKGVSSSDPAEQQEQKDQKQDAEKKLRNFLCAALLLPSAVQVPTSRVAWVDEGTLDTGEVGGRCSLVDGDFTPDAKLDTKTSPGTIAKRHALLMRSFGGDGEGERMVALGTAIAGAIRTWEILRSGEPPSWFAERRAAVKHHTDGHAWGHGGGAAVEEYGPLSNILAAEYRGIIVENVEAEESTVDGMSGLWATLFPPKHPLWDPAGDPGPEVRRAVDDLLRGDADPEANGSRANFIKTFAEQEEVKDAIAILAGGVRDEGKSTSAPMRPLDKKASGDGESKAEQAGQVLARELAKHYKTVVLDQLLKVQQRIVPMKDLFQKTTETLKKAVYSSNDDAKDAMELRLKLGIFRQQETTAETEADAETMAETKSLVKAIEDAQRIEEVEAERLEKREE